jgi:hypothetical protein
MSFRIAIDVPYALKDGAIVHVSQVLRGLDCNCSCVHCGGPLVARKGVQRRHHFAHYRDSSCPGAAESLLHLLAKELLSTGETIALPEYIYRAKSKPKYRKPVAIERQVVSASRARIAGVAVEQPLGDIVPDLLLHLEGGDLIIEIAVSHRVDRAKLRRIRRMNLPAIEISLGAEDLWLPREALLQRLIEETSIKSWLFHPAQRTAEADWFRARRRRPPPIHHEVSRIDAAATAIRQRRLTRSTWRSYNDWAEQFFRQFGRYPTLEENQAFERQSRKR